MSELGAAFARGTAVRLRHQDRINNEYRLFQEKVQARGREEERMFRMMDDVKFGQTFDEYNRGKYENFANEKIMEIADLARQNPSTNPQIMGQILQKKQELLDNEFTRASFDTKAQVDAFEEYIQKNPDRLDEREIAEAQKQIENVLLTGDIYGEETQGRKFRFNPPPLALDLDKILVDTFQNLKMDGMERLMENGAYTYMDKYYVTEEDIAKGARALADGDGLDSREVHKLYKEKSENPDFKNAFPTIYDWLERLGSSFVKDPEIKPNTAQAYAHSVYNRQYGSGNDDTPVDVYKTNYYDKAIQKYRQEQLAGSEKGYVETSIPNLQAMLEAGLGFKEKMIREATWDITLDRDGKPSKAFTFDNMSEIEIPGKTKLVETPSGFVHKAQVRGKIDNTELIKQYAKNVNAKFGQKVLIIKDQDLDEVEHLQINPAFQDMFSIDNLDEEDTPPSIKSYRMV